MDRNTLVDPLFPDCPVRNILSRIGDKWSILALHTLEEANGEPVRFKELQRRLPDISQKMLSVTLRTLEEDGYVSRKVFAEVPPRVEYSLTPLSVSLLPHVNALVAWAVAHYDEVMSCRRAKVGAKPTFPSSSQSCPR